MNEENLIQALKASRPQAPAAPANEWARVERATRPFSLGLRRFFSPGFALGTGLAMAGLAFFVAPYFSSTPSAADQASLEPFLSELSAEFSGAESTLEAHEDSYLALVDDVN